MRNMSSKGKTSTTHPKWKQHMEDALIAPTVQLPKAVIKIIQSYSFYHPIYEDDVTRIPKTISSPNDLVNYFVQSTHQEVKSLTYHGRGNVYQDIVASNGMSHAAFEVIRTDLIANLVDMPLFNELQSLIKDNDVKKDRIAEMLIRPMLSTVLGAGNCHEQSAMALIIMQRHIDYYMQLQHTIKEISVVNATADHVYVQIKLKDNSIYICDPWNNFSGKLNDNFFDYPGYANCIIAPESVYPLRGLTNYLTPSDTLAFRKLLHQDLDPFTILEVVNTRDCTGLNATANSIAEFLSSIQDLYTHDFIARLAETSMKKIDKLTGIYHDSSSKLQIEVLNTASAAATTQDNTSEAAATPGKQFKTLL